MTSFEELQHKAYLNDRHIDRFGSGNQYTYRIFSKAIPNVRGEELVATASSLVEADKILGNVRKKYLRTPPKEAQQEKPKGNPRKGDYWGEAAKRESKTIRGKNSYYQKGEYGYDLFAADRQSGAYFKVESGAFQHARNEAGARRNLREISKK